jgi:hypothetical protein
VGNRSQCGQQRLAVAKRQAERDAKRREHRAKARQARTSNHHGQWELREGDCIEEMAKIKPNGGKGEAEKVAEKGGGKGVRNLS